MEPMQPAETMQPLAPDRALLLALSRRLEYPGDGDGERQAAYTAAFDLAPITSPYLGDHLFGATAARHAFLAKVTRMTREAGLETGRELADHLALVLRLCALAPPHEDLDVLARDGALPVARRMRAALAEARSPYAEVLDAVVAALEGACGDHGPRLAASGVTP
jgi:nitrate reductase assembly molybdenum cofactor insertion protein NarJ